MGKWILAIIIAILAIGCLLISIFQFKEQGFLLNNAYLFATQQQRKRMNKKPYYRQSGIVFAFLAAILLCLAAEIMAETGWLLYIVWILAAAAVAFAIISTIRIVKKK